MTTPSISPKAENQLCHHARETRALLALVSRMSVLTIVLVGVGFAHGTDHPGRVGGVPKGVDESDWNGICAFHEAERHAVRRTGQNWESFNPGQQWRTTFDGRGFTTTPTGQGWRWGLELKSFGFGGREQEVVGRPAVKSEGQRFAYDWTTSLQEWFVNDSRGLEHGFTVRERPADATDGVGPLQFTLNVRGSLSPRVTDDGLGISFQDEAGAIVVDYAGLKVWDANGKILPAHFVDVDDGVRILLDEREAVYPITVDPIAQPTYLKASNAQAYDSFGRSVAVSGDTVVVGAWNDTGPQTAYVFVRSGAAWTQQATLQPSSPDNGFGQSVAVSGDTAVIGGEDKVFVFVRSGTNWSQQASLTGLNTEAGDGFGGSVAVSGNTLIVGASQENGSGTGVNPPSNETTLWAGAAYVFVRNGTTWTQQAYLKASNTEAYDRFGGAVAIDGDTAIVGTIYESGSGTGINPPSNESAPLAGAAYVFVRGGTTWSQQAYLKASNTEAFDYFGCSVAISGNTIVVGAYEEDGSKTGVNQPSDNLATDAGAAYVFVRNGNTWSQQAYLKASNTDPDDFFGGSVAISGDRIVVTAESEDGSGIGLNPPSDNLTPGAGAAYVFVRSGATWIQQHYLKASNPGGPSASKDYEGFGVTAAISGGNVVIGAPGEDGSGTGVNPPSNELALNAGAAYTYVLQVPISEAVDAPALVWTSGGSQPWFGDVFTTHDGVDAGQSGDVNDNQESWLETSVTGPGTLTFWWKVSSEVNFDFLGFLIDGVEQTGSISGEVGWTQKTFGISAGTHTLRWRYTKDGIVSSGADAAWLDQVFFTTITPPTVTTGSTVTFGPNGTAMIRGTVNSNNGNASSFFRYGVTPPAYGSTAVAGPLVSGSQAVEVTATIAGLTPNTTYHYQLHADNEAGGGDGLDATFRVPNNMATLTGITPSVGTLSPAFNPSLPPHYSVNVSNTTTSISFIPTTAVGSNAIIQYAGAPINSGASTASQSLSVGNNYFLFDVNSEDGFVRTTYDVNVIRAASNNADLANLVTGAGTLSPVFSASTVNYTASVSNATSSMTVTPTTADPNASITVNGATVASGAASGFITLNVGTNTISTVVTAQDGTTTKTYTVAVTRAAPASTNADLANLVPSAGTLSPAFSAATTSYTAGVGNATASITVTPTKADANATIRVNGVTVASGSPSAAISLNVGTNTITSVVTAQDGIATKTYTVAITRAAPASTNADLANLVPSAGTLSPAFAAATTSYTAGVGNATASITVTPTKADANATIRVNGVTVASGSPSAAISLNVGTNTITSVVTAQDGIATKTYTVAVTRAAPPSTNADLANLVPSAGTLSPAFAAATTSYTASVSNASGSMTVTPTAAGPSATVKVNGVTVTSGTASGSILLNVGSNTISTVVTAQDGTTTKTYTVAVTRAAPPSTNADLANLLPSAGTLSPAFSAATTSYTASVSNAISSVTVTPTKSDPNAVITVNGATVPSGTASGPISLNVGPNTITTVVTAQDGTTTKTYTVAVTRAAPPSTNADLANLVPSAGTLSPAFSAATTSYTAGVGNATASITVTPTKADANATTRVNGVTVASGSPSAAIALNVGRNTINTVVTAQDGTTTKTYTLDVTRAEPPSTNADLSNLVPSTGTLSPAFSASTLSYSASVSNATSSMTVTPTTADPNATIRVNGVTVASGAPSAAIALNVDRNTITTVVTAQDGTTTNTYTLTVTRATAGPLAARLTSPVNGSTLTSTTTTFSWDAGVGVSSYYLFVGTTVDGYDILQGSQQTTLSRAVTGLPVDKKIFVTLYSTINGNFSQNRYVFDPVASVKADLISHANGSTLSGSTVTFTWTAGVGVSHYAVWIGSDYARKENGDSGLMANNNSGGPFSWTFNNIPQNGGPVYVSLYSLINNVWQANYYWLTTAPPVSGNRPAKLISPINGTILTSSYLDLTWDAGLGVASYALDVGSTPGGIDIRRNLNETAFSRRVTVPTDGRPIFVTLSSWIGTGYQSLRYRFTASRDEDASQFIDPPSGTALATSTLSLEWTSVPGASKYYLRVSDAPDSPTGSGPYIYDADQGTALRRTITLTKNQGQPVYATLYTWINGDWKKSSAWYYTWKDPSPDPGRPDPKFATFTNQDNGGQLVGASIIFNWDGVGGATSYALWIGSSPGAYDLWASNEAASSSTRTVNLPTDGRTIYVTLWTRISGAWQNSSYFYTAADIPLTRAELTFPVAGSTLPGSTATFTWAQGNGASLYAIWIGRKPGGNDIYGGIEGTALSKIVGHLPTDGGPVYVRLWSLINGAWQSNDYIYNAAINP